MRVVGNNEEEGGKGHGIGNEGAMVMATAMRAMATRVAGKQWQRQQRKRQ